MIEPLSILMLRKVQTGIIEGNEESLALASDSLADMSDAAILEMDECEDDPSEEIITSFEQSLKNGDPDIVHDLAMIMKLERLANSLPRDPSV